MTVGKGTNLVLNIIMIGIMVVTLVPILLVVAISLTSSEAIREFGFSLIPQEFSLEAYRYIFRNPDTIFRAYGVTIFVTVVGAILSTLVISLFAYAISRKDYRLNKFSSIFILITMLFSGGTVASYIINVNLYHLDDTVWIMILPYVMNVWNVFIMRSFFQTSVPMEIIESGKLDGAGEWYIFFKLVIPIAVPGIATIALFQTLTYWNDWWMSMLYIMDSRLYNLQFLLQQMMQNIQRLTQDSRYIANAAEQMLKVPSESARMALCIVAMGPILVIYPFFQRYFIEGLTVGAVKG